MLSKPKTPRRLLNRFSCIFACFSAKAKGRAGYSLDEKEFVDDYFVKRNLMVSVAGNVIVSAFNEFRKSALETLPNNLP